MTDVADRFDFLSPDLIQNPFEADAAARAEQPIFKAPGSDIYMVFSYDLIDEVLSQPELFSSRNEEMMLGRSIHDPECQAIFAKGWPQAETLLNNDPPSHTRFKRLVLKAFADTHVSKMKTYINEVVTKLLDDMQETDECEFISAFAMPLPALVIAKQMGIPDSDIQKVKVWSNSFIELIGSYLPHEQELKQAELVVEFQHYLKARIDERRESPQQDMLSVLLNAHEGTDDEPLSTAELLNIVQQIIVAGNTTTTHMLAAGVYYLIQHPETFKQIKSDITLVPKLVKELLRLESPTYSMWRKATADTSLNGVEIPEGAQLMIRFGSGNRDEKHFECPHELQLDRNSKSKHMAFSKGIHNCIGAPLAKAELNISFAEIITRLDNLRLAKDKPAPNYLPNLQLRGLDQLNIAFD